MRQRVVCAIVFFMVFSAFICAGEVRIPIPAEAQTSMSQKENFHHKTLARMAYQGRHIEIPIFRYDLRPFKGNKLARVEMTMNVEKERKKDYTIILKAVGGDELIPWDAKNATLRKACS